MEHRPRRPGCSGSVTEDMHKYAFIGITAALVLGGVGYYSYHLSKAPVYTMMPVQRGTITQEVSASGNVATPTTTDLQFQTSGRLVAVGDKVSAGEAFLNGAEGGT